MSQQLQNELREEINLLISEAEELLNTRAAFYTEGNKLAITDMLNLAKQTLQPQYEAPFTRNRSFYNVTALEKLQFIVKRYTMVPPFQQEGDVYTHYGLEQLIHWFKQQDSMYGSAEQILARAKLTCQQSEELLQQTVIGDEVGQFPRAYVEHLQQDLKILQQQLTDISRLELTSSCTQPKTKLPIGQLEHLEHSEQLDRFEHLEQLELAHTPTEQAQFAEPQNIAAALQQLALQTVACRNSLRACRHARILRSDIEPACNLYISEQQRPAVLEAIVNDPIIASYYEQIKLNAERFNLDYIKQALNDISYEQASYEQLNQRYTLWSSSEKVINFKAPIGASYGKLSFILPSESNETDGLGHIWLKNIAIHSASKGELPIANGSFARGDKMPEAWSFNVHKGNPQARMEREYPYNGSSDPAVPAQSVYLCNPTSNDEVSIAYNESLELQAGETYTIQFNAKIDGKLNRGLIIRLDFNNDQHQSIGQFTYSFNRKSSIGGGQFQLPMQCDAIQYWLSGEVIYAEKVKYALLFMFNDFCQGAEHWLITNLRPEGSDSYGAVQAGRLLSVAAVSYSLIKEADVFSPEEKNRFYGLVQYLLHYVLDLRDRTEWTAYEAQQGCSNWQTDMCAGAALMMMALPDFPNRLAWLYNAEAVLKAQLALNVNGDHSWPESIRYHVAALERFAGYAKVSQFITGQQWFTNDSVLPAMFKYLVDMQTPPYRYFNNTIGTPPFGDHALTAGAEYGCFPVYIRDIAALNPQLADEMYHTWVAAGTPMKKIWGEGIIFENLISSLLDYRALLSLSLSTTLHYPDSGNYIFRYQDELQQEHFFAIMSSPAKIAHGHLDQGSFIMYYDGVPLIMDSGIEGYFDATTQWHISSYSHACVQFSTTEQVTWSKQPASINLNAGTYSLERGWLDTPVNSKVKRAAITEEIDEIVIEIANPSGIGTHLRHVTLLKRLGITIISDAIIGFDEHVLLTLPLAAKDIEQQDNMLHMTTYSDVELNVYLLLPTESITVEQGRSTHFMEGEDKSCSYMTYMRAIAKGNVGFLTLLAPRKAEMKPVVIQQHPSKGYIITSNGVSYYVRMDNNELLATSLTSIQLEDKTL